jgi:heptosyltransferase-3
MNLQPGSAVLRKLRPFAGSRFFVKSVFSFLQRILACVCHPAILSEYEQHVWRTRFSFLVNYTQLFLIRHWFNLTSRSRQFVVITLTEHMGDIVACEPVARYARRLYADAYIIWTIRKAYVSLVAHNPHIDRLLVVNCLTEWIYFRRTGLFDIVIDLHVQYRVCPLCDLPLMKTEGNTDITGENYYYYGTLLSAFCQGAGIDLVDDEPRVYIPRQVGAHVDRLRLPSRFLVIHSTSNETDRDWDDQKWKELIPRITHELGVPVVEVGSGQRPHQPCHVDYINLCGRLSILETAEVIRRAAVFIGIDSGPAHLANAVGTRGVILLGHYRAFERYLPYSGQYGHGARAKLLYQDGPARDIPTERVFEAVSSLLRTPREALTSESTL